jgi:transposase
MDQGNQLFTLALGLVPPWKVNDVWFTAEERRLDLQVNFPKGSRFPCPVCGQDRPVHDTQEKVWAYLNFFQHANYLHARVPRVQCPECGVHGSSTH